jgi:hypothetical protein
LDGSRTHRALQKRGMETHIVDPSLDRNVRHTAFPSKSLTGTLRVAELYRI